MEGDDVARLLEDLDALIDALRAEGQLPWVDWLARDAARIRAGDGSGIAHLLQAYGGMGSLGDLLLDAPIVALRSEVYVKATALRRRLDE